MPYFLLSFFTPPVWYNWRAMSGIDISDLLYIVVFASLMWLSIMGIDYLYRRVKRKKKE